MQTRKTAVVQNAITQIILRVRTMDNEKTTIDDVAKALGLSKSTVSRSISGKGRISADTRQKVLDYIEERNYRPNTLAKG